MKIERLLAKVLFALTTLMFTQTTMLAAEGAEAADHALANAAKWMLIVTVVLIALTLWLTLVYSETNDNTGEKVLGPLRKFKQWFTQSTPVEKEEEIIFDHSYDGIRELDNKIPPWFNFLFYGTILFSIVYMLNYHVFGSGSVQEDEYAAEMALAEAQRHYLMETGAFLNEETVTRVTDAAALSSGKDIYDKNCASCHGFEGEGLVGPNLTDDYWKHGCSINDIFSVIKYGVQQAGMISWESQLQPTEMQEVASYVMTLHGNEVANEKAPEGEECISPSDAEGEENDS